ncbi:hypothetical protein [Gynuella sunshinyii]|uniref:Uncharacterized protein n=1 Tax=Gynuella sunshinyii YC6258 TaxID=1445510 RepID=A0A0C5VMJ3_9GAMM|nr:hypothetical protein [Gynuella sunshinyii]AJQ95536.1 hypothetical Protein YC6258_03500 [Gynuella sunshinyii YC6258]
MDRSARERLFWSVLLQNLLRDIEYLHYRHRDPVVQHNMVCQNIGLTFRIWYVRRWVVLLLSWFGINLTMKTKMIPPPLLTMLFHNKDTIYLEGNRHSSGWSVSATLKNRQNQSILKENIGWQELFPSSS